MCIRKILTRPALFLLWLLALSPSLYAEDAEVEDVSAIARLYSAAFDRVPKVDGLNFWVHSYESGRSLIDMAKDFYQSPEFTSRYGELGDQQYVEQLFLNVLGRPGAQGGVGFWTSHLSNDVSRAKVLASFTDSPENILKTSEIFANMRLSGGKWVFASGSSQCPEIVKIRIAAFIPGNFIQPPFGEECGTGSEAVFQNGNDRIDQFGKAVFNPSSMSFKAVHILEVYADGSVINPAVSGPAVLEVLKAVGETREYAWNALVDGQLGPEDDDGKPGDCDLFHRVGVASTDDISFDSSIDGNIVSLNIFGGASNPLVQSAPKIDWNYDIEINFSSDVPTYLFAGIHDGFPAHEVYINDVAIWRYDPGPPNCHGTVKSKEGETLLNFTDYCLGQVLALAGLLDETASPSSGPVPNINFNNECKPSISVSILSPNEKKEFVQGEEVAFLAIAEDNVGNSNFDFEWLSSIDGHLGFGASTTAQLSTGTHLITLTATSVMDASVEASDTITLFVTEPGEGCKLPQELLGAWEATEIEGAIDAQGNPLNIDGSVSTLEIFCDGSYKWFLHAPPFYVLDGEGGATFSGDTLQFTGALNDWLGVPSISYSVGNTNITFLDEDGDRWRYRHL